MKTTIKILFRLIVFPFIASVIVISGIRNILYTCYLWLSRGGELSMHDEVFNPETHRELSLKIKKLIDEKDSKDQPSK